MRQVAAKITGNRGQNYVIQSYECKPFYRYLIDKRMDTDDFFTEVGEDVLGSAPLLTLEPFEDLTLDECIGRTFSQILTGTFIPMYLGVRGKSIYLSYNKKRWIRIFRFQYSDRRIFGFSFRDKIYFAGEKGVLVSFEINKVGKRIIDEIEIDYVINDVYLVPNNEGILIGTPHALYFSTKIVSHLEPDRLLWQNKTRTVNRIIYVKELDRILLLGNKNAQVQLQVPKFDGIAYPYAHNRTPLKLVEVQRFSTNQLVSDIIELPEPDRYRVLFATTDLAYITSQDIMDRLQAFWTPINRIQNYLPSDLRISVFKNKAYIWNYAEPYTQLMYAFTYKK